MNGGVAGEGAEADGVVAFHADGNGSVQNADLRVAGDASDAHGRNTGGLEIAGAAEDLYPFTGAAAAAEADNLVA